MAHARDVEDVERAGRSGDLDHVGAELLLADPFAVDGDDLARAGLLQRCDYFGHRRIRLDVVRDEDGCSRERCDVQQHIVVLFVCRCLLLCVVLFVCCCLLLCCCRRADGHRCLFVRSQL